MSATTRSPRWRAAERGGGDQEENRISQRQKEIIAATWNEIRGGGKDKVNSAENARFLSEVQIKLKEQATSLAQRARSRELAGANQEFQSFVKDMEAAAAEMVPASDKLKGQSWKDALEPEQKALQHLLRAEATFRDIQVAFGGGNGGGGGGGAGRDLANLFDLELDTEKNQYETGQQQGSSGEQRQKEIDEALQKLEQLARRQQELAQSQQNKQTPEQRWQQEMLRREAEELKKQMEQLAAARIAVAIGTAGPVRAVGAIRTVRAIGTVRSIGTVFRTADAAPAGSTLAARARSGEAGDGRYALGAIGRAARVRTAQRTAKPTRAALRSA